MQVCSFWSAILETGLPWNRLMQETHNLAHAYPMFASAEHKALWPGFLVRLFLTFFLCPFLDLKKNI